jgi:hypothetical protein
MANVYNLVMPDETEGPARAIVRKIRRPGVLQAAEEVWRETQKRHENLTAQLRSVIAQIQQSGGDPTGADVRRVNTLNAEVTKVAAELSAALSDVLARREPYARSIVAAVAPYRATIAGEALAALDQARRHFAELEALDDEVSAAGGPARRTSWREHLGGLTALLQRIAQGKG